MMAFLIPFSAFVAVILFMLLVYGAWVYFFDPRNKAKKKRLQSTLKTVHGGGTTPTNTTIAKNILEASAFEIWLRSRFGFFKQLENLLLRASSPFTVGQLMSLMFALFMVIVVFGLLLQTNPLFLLVLAIAIASTPLLWLSRKADQRSKALEDKLPETLDYISRALRAGHSLTSAIIEVGREFPAPIGPEFKTLADEIAFGISFKEAFGHLAERVQSNDINFFVVSIVIQHETGGNLTEVLDGLSTTIRERAKLRGKVRTLSSEGRASGWVLGAMPFVFAAIMTLINPGYISVLWNTPQGHTLLFICFGLMVFGIMVLNRIVQIKV